MPAGPMPAAVFPVKDNIKIWRWYREICTLVKN
nr:MAG TPA: hypothetical protein [Bacteriophage sp.]DAW06823.1 MAG TPA: hypothetical protein [Bacteriophage sp.]